MKKISLIIPYILFVVANLYSQESYIKSRWNLRLAYAHYQTNISSSKTGTAWKYETTGNYQIEANYGILNFFEAGIYTGYSSYYSTNKLYTYGTNINVHILPLVIKAKSFRIDTYLAGKVGGNYYNSEHSNNDNVLEYGIGFGSAFYPFKRLGVFAEYSFGEYFFEDNKKFRAGVTFKFKK